MTQPPSSKVCVLCGTHASTTHDHLPPRGFFKGTAAHFITVPACAACNNGARDDDEAVRTYISLFAGNSTAQTNALWTQGALKALKNNGRLRKLANFHPAVDGLGQPRIAAFMPERPYQVVMGRIARGLYFHHTAEILGVQVPVVATPYFERPRLAPLPDAEMHKVAGDAFGYSFWRAEDDPTSTVWLFSFYAAHWTVVVTGKAI